jgi:methyl-accepting chemotaxis protein
MDQGTQQNASLVEELNASAIALQRQAQDLLDTVEAFKI